VTAAMRVLVLSNETLASPNVIAEVAQRTQLDPSPVLLVAPARAGWDRRGRRRARWRLRDSVDALKMLGVSARGELGVSDPVEALVDAHEGFHSEHVIIATPPQPGSRWIDDGVLDHARLEVDVPVHHIVADRPRANPSIGDGQRIIRLYHFVEPEQAELLVQAGSYGGAQDGAGVWMIASRAGRRGRGKFAFAIDVPIDSVRPFEREPGFHDERRFLIPAGILSGLGRFAPLDG